MFRFEELDETTRTHMLEEFKKEESGTPYRSPHFTKAGLEAFPGAMEAAIRGGSEVTLSASLHSPVYWVPTFPRKLPKGGFTQVTVNPVDFAKRLAITEFSTWYVRGLCGRLLREGETLCQVYRADSAAVPRGECLQYEEQVCDVKLVYDGHRARYWPNQDNPTAFSIPVGPNCHHSIRRYTKG